MALSIWARRGAPPTLSETAEGWGTLGQFRHCESLYDGALEKISTTTAELELATSAATLSITITITMKELLAGCCSRVDGEGTCNLE
jgi:hypothetical protein